MRRAGLVQAGAIERGQRGDGGVAVAAEQTAGVVEKDDRDVAEVAEIEADRRRPGRAVDLAGGDPEQRVDKRRVECRRRRRHQHDGAGADDEHGAGDGDEIDPPDEPETHPAPPVDSM